MKGDDCEVLFSVIEEQGLARVRQFQPNNRRQHQPRKPSKHNKNKVHDSDSTVVGRQHPIFKKMGDASVP
jgi:hypothetical protein